MARLCEEMAEYFRSLMLFKTMKDPSALLTLPPTQLDALEQQAYTMSLPAILHGMDALEEALHKMRYANQRTQLEMAFVRLCTPELDASPAALVRLPLGAMTGRKPPLARWGRKARGRSRRCLNGRRPLPRRQRRHRKRQRLRRPSQSPPSRRWTLRPFLRRPSGLGSGRKFCR